MRPRLIYRARPTDEPTDTSHDDVLISQFQEWRNGSNEFICRNEVLQRDLYHEFHRTPMQVWQKAEEFKRQAVVSEAKQYFSRIVQIYKDKTIYAR